MAHIFFEEQQQLTNVRWLWIVIIGAMVTPLIPIAFVSDIPDQDLTMLLISAFGFIPILGLLYFVRLYIRIDNEGFHYKFFPAQWSWKSIDLKTIKNIDFNPVVNFIDRNTIGHRLNRFTNTLRMNITGKSFIQIQLSTGRKILVGTENHEVMMRALNRLTNRTIE